MKKILNKIKIPILLAVYTGFLCGLAAAFLLFGFGGMLILGLGAGVEGYNLWLDFTKQAFIEIFLIVSLASFVAYLIV